MSVTGPGQQGRRLDYYKGLPHSSHCRSGESPCIILFIALHGEPFKLLDSEGRQAIIVNRRLMLIERKIHGALQNKPISSRGMSMPATKEQIMELVRSMPNDVTRDRFD